MINNIQLINFRSYKKIEIDLSEEINVFVGKNGQGKTNLIEAIYYISNIRSHRTKNDRDLINTNENFSRIIVEAETFNKKEKLMCVIHSGGKYFSINNNMVAKTSDILGRVNTLLFYPNETKIFSDTPSSRRTFFDVEIGKVSKEYINEFRDYNNLLKDRNVLLKEDKVDKILLEIITKKLIEKQLSIIKEREFITEFINDKINPILMKFSRNKLNIKMNYMSKVKKSNFGQLLKIYNSSIDRDIQARTTTEGIHRDDYEFTIENIEISKYLSQGQTRLVLLAIKFVLIDYIILKSNIKPILLLDDVLSELDEVHQKKLIENIPRDLQTIITSTNHYDVFKKNNIKIFKIRESQVIQEEEFDVRG